SYSCRAGSCPGSSPVSTMTIRIPASRARAWAWSISARPTPLPWWSGSTTTTWTSPIESPAWIRGQAPPTPAPAPTATSTRPAVPLPGLPAVRPEAVVHELRHGPAQAGEDRRPGADRQVERRRAVRRPVRLDPQVIGGAIAALLRCIVHAPEPTEARGAA